MAKLNFRGLSVVSGQENFHVHHMYYVELYTAEEPLLLLN